MLSASSFESYLIGLGVARMCYLSYQFFGFYGPVGSMLLT